MATQQRTVDFLVEQVARAGAVTQRKMFGEFALYCDGKVVALVCDDELFVKPTVAAHQRHHFAVAVVGVFAEHLALRDGPRPGDLLDEKVHGPLLGGHWCSLRLWEGGWPPV